MKQIKFRAINKWFSDSEMVYFDVYQGCSDIIEKSKPNADWKIMQFTGLLDKNGKEIYEGDVVRCRFAFGDNICEIVEDNGCYWVSQKNRGIKDKAYDNLYWHVDGIEVIGNIYENPELLK